jgi:hypothetical protein
MLADQLVLIAPTPGLVKWFGLWRTPLHEPDGKHDVQEELQILRLPVLRNVNGKSDEVRYAPRLAWGSSMSSARSL